MGKSMGEEIRYISLFSGVEACSVAWYHMKNWKAQAFAEFDAFPSAVLKYHFPHVPNVGDVTKHEWSQYKGKCELIVGGSPCQSFSVAGKRLGLDDPRGNLALHFLRVVKEVQPTWFIFENVPGLLSSDNGRDFAAFLREVENIGYGCAYRVLDAQHFGVPQRRRRLFVIGHIDGDFRRAAAVLFEPEGLSGNTPKSYKERQNTAPDSGSSTTERGEYWNGRRIANTLTASTHKRQTMPDKDRLDAVIVPKLPSGIDLFNQEETGEVHVPLRTAQGHGAPAVMQQPWRMAKAPMSKDDFARWEESESHPTLNTFANHGENRLQSAITVDMVVRRLTPLECERLQGFPDNWTLIPWKRKTRENCPDGPRFKAMGNSMAVPVMRWIGEGVELVNSIPKTNVPEIQELGWL